MKYSTDRIKTLALKIHNQLYHDNLVTYKNDDESLRVMKDVMLQFFDAEDKIDSAVLAKLQAKKLTPGTAEWKILYQKYFEEEARRFGL